MTSPLSGGGSSGQTLMLISKGNVCIFSQCMNLQGDRPTTYGDNYRLDNYPGDNYPGDNYPLDNYPGDNYPGDN